MTRQISEILRADAADTRIGHGSPCLRHGTVHVNAAGRVLNHENIESFMARNSLYESSPEKRGRDGMRKTPVILLPCPAPAETPHLFGSVPLI